MTDKVKAILAYARERFGTEPEYLWKTAPNYVVLRNKLNNKWYAIIMDVPRGSLGFEGDGVLWVMNVKCDPIMMGSLRGKSGFCPAYHMNKDKWITILLDGSAGQEDIKALLAISYSMTAVKLRRKSVT